MSARLSEAQYAALSGMPISKPSKYRAVPVIVTEAGDVYEAKAAKANQITGRRFASKAEARRYLELKMLERAGQISELECQPRFELHALDGSKLAVYLGDFKFYDRREKCLVVEDVKGARGRGRGTRTAVYELKRKLVRGEYGVDIREVGA